MKITWLFIMNLSLNSERALHFRDHTYLPSGKKDARKCNKTSELYDSEPAPWMCVVTQLELCTKGTSDLRDHWVKLINTKW